MQAHSKRAKLAARRARNAADRALALKLRVPSGIGLVEAAEMAVEDAQDERARKEAKRREQRGFADRWPMDVYLEKGEVTQLQHSDAETLRNDWERSGLATKGAAFDGVISRGLPEFPGGGPGWVGYMAAMRALGPIATVVLVEVALSGRTAEQWAEDRKLPKREGLKALRQSLDLLGAHYRGARHLLLHQQHD